VRIPGAGLEGGPESSAAIRGQSHVAKLHVGPSARRALFSRPRFVDQADTDAQSDPLFAKKICPLRAGRTTCARISLAAKREQ